MYNRLYKHIYILCIIDTVGVRKLRTTFLMDSDGFSVRWGESTDQAAYVALLEAAEFSLFLDGNTYGKSMWIHDILWISMVNFQWHLVFICFYWWDRLASLQVDTGSLSLKIPQTVAIQWGKWSQSFKFEGNMFSDKPISTLHFAKPC